MSRPRSAIVVGGGVAGLVTAWELARAGIAVTVVEASGQLGGCVARHRVGGLDLDAGAESFATASPAVADLAVDLGLATALVDPAPVGAWVEHEAGAAPLPPGGVLGIPARPWGRETRACLGTMGAARAGLDALLPAGVGAGATTLGELVRTRMGARVVRRLVEPVAGGVYSADPGRLELASVQPRLQPLLARTGSLARAARALRPSVRPGSAVQGLRGGMFELVVALHAAATAAGVVVWTDSPARSLRRADTGVEIGGAARSWTADVVVVATDQPALLDGLAPSRPPTPTSDVLLVTLVLDAPELDRAPRGTGVLVAAAAPGVTAKALTHATAKWPWLAERAGPGRHVLRLSYGRGTAPGPDVGVDLAVRDAARLLGIPLSAADVVDAGLRRWTSALPTPQPGQAAAITALRAGLPPDVAVTGAWVAGTGLAAVVADARRTAAAVVAGARDSAG